MLLGSASDSVRTLEDIPLESSDEHADGPKHSVEQRDPGERSLPKLCTDETLGMHRLWIFQSNDPVYCTGQSYGQGTDALCLCFGVRSQCTSGRWITERSDEFRDPLSQCRLGRWLCESVS